MELAATVEAVKRLGNAFPGVKLTADNVQAYAIRLMPFDDASVNEAIERAITRLDRFPSIAALLGIVAEQLAGAPDVDNAWAEVLTSIRRYGRYGVPRKGGGYDAVTWSHPAIEDVVRSMGWLSLCDSDNIAADRAHFLKLYETASKRHKRSVSEVAAPALAAGPTWQHAGAQDPESIGPLVLRQALPVRVER
jgi:hypothetical protein